MKGKKEQKTDYLFEISWEVCNKIGGIYTAISTKVLRLDKEVKGHIMIGPDIIREDDNLSFIEDTELLKVWKMKAIQDGLRVRIGRWNIEGKPIAILVDFTNLFSQKDQIFKELWEQYKLDSISGQWDYVEPALFGYAAGKVIEHYAKFYLSPRNKIIAHFHEWMTGAGLLYLKHKTPQIACIFTSHATVVGRSIAFNGLSLYRNISNYNADAKAIDFDVVAKHSLEKNAALQADCFTTISNIIANESKYFLGKDADVITPNGFEKTFVPTGKEFEKKYDAGRKKLSQVAEIIINDKISNDAVFIGLSGRYEFRNKGIDVFIESLGKLNKNKNLEKQVIAFLFVPSAHHGQSKELMQNIANNNNDIQLTNQYTTHYLIDPEYDAILQAIKIAELHNSKDDKVKIIFVPSYLNGNDGIFNLPYYNLLMSLDLTVFPSYYQPWGYNVLESLAFKVPTITTSITGIGNRIITEHPKDHPAIEIIERNDNNYQEVAGIIEKKIISFSKLNEKDIEKLKRNADELSSIALWDNFITYYLQSYKIALEKAALRKESVSVLSYEETTSSQTEHTIVEQPIWTGVIVQPNIPSSLAALSEISKNLWWCWDQESIELFKYIDKETFTKTNRNPIALIDTISSKRYQELKNDEEFVKKLNDVYKRFKEYMSVKKLIKKPQIAYFCMEYGLQASLKIYSGGLGILAGDYLKEASDKGTAITAVGFLYRYGYFTQKISATGDQVAEYEAQDFTKIPVTPVRDSDGHWLTISIAFPGRTVYARTWKVEVGRTDLYLLDTDFEDNLPEDREITHQLYGGNWENRLKQELILGVGGIRLLNKLGVDADVYHCNEGHAAFIGLERIRQFIEVEKLTFDEATEIVRSSSLFTTHTPVPAGHDAFEENLLRKYISHYPERFKISWKYLMGLGRSNPNNQNEKFSMSVLAANLSQEVNGVSRLHGKVSREIMTNIWTGYMPEELHISSVTNGVHLPTWAAPQWKEVFNTEFGEDFRSHNYDKKCFEKIYNVDDKKIWDIRKALKMNLIEHIRTRVSSKENIVHFTPQQVIKISQTLSSDKLTIGFARRFATYKRAHLLFKNIERLNLIVNNSEHPVQFLFAGKAHPADKAGQDLIRMIVEYSKLPQFMGKIIFLDNYDMELARRMVQGVDIWLNTPTRPLEASGTSGEKAVLNGVMHFSVLDGWWVEGYRSDAGWCLPMQRTYENQDFQDQMDSEIIYNTIENEIAPLYYNRNANDIPTDWVKYIKNSIAHVASNFTTNRMLTDYEDCYYNKLSKRHSSLVKNDYEKAKYIADWKRSVNREWNNIKIISADRLDTAKETIVLDKKYDLEIILNIGLLKPEDVGVEIVFAENKNDKIVVCRTQEFKIANSEGNVVTYRTKIEMDMPGIYMSGYRVFPKNPLLPHRQDFDLVKWI
ncbi:MAG: alpha-glucan family phosphorylase [Prevotellaceae bacterium]|jgi:phosphorylase/glycogen(starch) synthase|nr:alpha-glucan family phosphorylase [Prevotellaceae bacterium]